METKYITIPFDVGVERKSCRANNTKRIACYDYNGNLVCVYTSCAEAARNTGLKNHTIFKRCKNGNSGIDNLRFKYFNGDFSNICALEKVRNPNLPIDAKDISDMTFGYIKVLGFSHVKHRQVYWNCICKCGRKLIINGISLRAGHTKSCGCMKNVKHHLTSHQLFRVWNSMKGRCGNKNNKSYKDYGGRGIQVCQEWYYDFMSFYDWSINNGYKKGSSIDRIDVNGNYEPSNCRWIPMSLQAGNKRNTIRINYRDKEYTLPELSKITGLKRYILYHKYKRGSLIGFLESVLPYNDQTAHLLGTSNDPE